MDKRQFQRITNNLEAEIISGGQVYSGIIMNFSEAGLYMVTATANRIVDITPSTILQLKCKLPAGNNLTMDCEVKWFQTKTSPHGVTFSMGMEIINPPQEYKDFISSQI